MHLSGSAPNAWARWRGKFLAQTLPNLRHLYQKKILRNRVLHNSEKLKRACTKKQRVKGRISLPTRTEDHCYSYARPELVCKGFFQVLTVLTPVLAVKRFDRDINLIGQVNTIHINAESLRVRSRNIKRLDSTMFAK